MATIGCDPELTLRLDLLAKRPITYRKTTYEAINICGDIVAHKTINGSFGRDGARKLFEIRPEPSISPAEIVRRMGTILGELETHIHTYVVRHFIRGHVRDTSLYVGSYDQVVGGIGGHFHAGLRPTNLNNTNNTKVCLGLSLLWALEDYDFGKLRRQYTPDHHGYGGIMDMRPGANNITTEYRTPSSDWMARPALAKAALGYFRSLVLSRKELFPDTAQMGETYILANRYWETLTSANRQKYLDSILKEVKRHVNKQDLSTITFFADKIEGLREETTKLIRLDTHKWRETAKCVD